MSDDLGAFARYVGDLALFCEHFLTPLRGWQIEAARAIASNPRFAAKTARGVGKTHLLACTLLWYHLTRPMSVCSALAPVWSQLAFLWSTLTRLFETSPALRGQLPGWSLQQNQLLSPIAGWKIEGFSGESGDKIEGLHAPPGAGALVAFDEARNVDAGIAARLMKVGAGHADFKCIAFSTPGVARGFFFDIFRDERWHTTTVSAKDVPHLRDHYEQELAERGKSDAFFLQQTAGEFCDVGETDAVLDYELLARAVARSRHEPHLQEVSAWTKMLSPRPTYERVLGVDVAAGRGGDSSIAILRAGPNFGPVFDLGNRRDPMEVIGRVVRLTDEYRVSRVVIDSAGMGSVFSSRLREVFRTRKFGRDVTTEDYFASARATNAEFFSNLKSELCYQLKERLRVGAVTLPDDKRLLAELSSLTASVDSRGRVKVNDPPGRSPDRADALLCSLAETPVSVATIRARGL